MGVYFADTGRAELIYARTTWYVLAAIPPCAKTAGEANYAPESVIDPTAMLCYMRAKQSQMMASHRSPTTTIPAKIHCTANLMRHPAGRHTRSSLAQAPPQVAVGVKAPVPKPLPGQELQAYFNQLYAR